MQFVLYFLLCLQCVTDFSHAVKKPRWLIRRDLSAEGRIDKYFNNYLSYRSMQNVLRTLQLLYPDRITSRLIGTSSQGRKIRLYSIQNNRSKNCVYKKRKPDEQKPSNQWEERLINTRKYYASRILSNHTHNDIHLEKDEEEKDGVQHRKPAVFIDGGMHSREWVSPAAVMYLLAKLASSDSLSKNIDWHIVPMVNPDGYVHSQNNDRMWRKTVSRTYNANCFGADINRNFGYKWGEIDTSVNPCAENYGGSRENSEPETRAMINALSTLKGSLQAYISVHNWGQDILYPYTHTKDIRPRNENELKRVGEGMSRAIKRRQNVVYQTGMSSSQLYPASGTALDWAYEMLKIPLAYLIELRDNGKSGFYLPEYLIKDTGKDLFYAMEFLAKEIEKKYVKIC